MVNRILGISFFGLLLAGSATSSAGPDRQAPQTSHTIASSNFYKVARIFPSHDTGGFTIAIVTIDANRFNVADLRVLACELNRDFDKFSRVRAGLLDDENAARLFLKGNLEMSEFERARRGLYYLDRTKKQEYIQLSSQNGKAKRQVKIRMKCG